MGLIQKYTYLKINVIMQTSQVYLYSILQTSQRHSSSARPGIMTVLYK